MRPLDPITRALLETPPGEYPRGWRTVGDCPPLPTRSTVAPFTADEIADVPRGWTVADVAILCGTIVNPIAFLGWMAYLFLTH